MPDISPTRHPIRGYLYIAGATFCWGVSAALGKAVFSGRLMGGAAVNPIDPLILSQTRTTIAFLLLLPLLLAFRGRRLVDFGRSEWLKCLLIGAAGINGSNFFYYFAIQRTSVAIGITLQYFAPIFVLAYLIARRRQRPTVQRVGGVLLAVIGSALAIGLVGAQWKLDPLGVASGLGAAVSFAFYTLMGHTLLQRHDRWAVFLWALFGSALCWAAINPPTRILAAHYSASQWSFMLCFSVLSILCAYSLYFAGLQHLDATRAVVTSCLEAVFAIGIARVYPGERPSPVQLLGIAIVLFATLVVQLPERRQPVVADATELGLPGA